MQSSPQPAPPISTLRSLLGSEAFGAVLLLLAAALAVVLANSSLAGAYFATLHHPLSLGAGTLSLEKEVEHWVNDGLMVVFFLLVGLEIKREMTEGRLANLRLALLPIAGAVGGMVLPAIIFIALNHGTPASRGWGIPVATDIAFALGILALVGAALPPFLRTFLAALAIIDDLGAVLVIAMFYTSSVSPAALLGACGTFVSLLLLNRFRVQALSPYLVGGVVLWLFVLNSGVHATIAGVLLAFTIPVRHKDGSEGPLHRLEHALLPWVTYFILPTFALASAGVPLGDSARLVGRDPLSLGIFFGLVIGKIGGISAAVFLVTASRCASLPPEIRTRHIVGISALGGIGFTMSLFIAGLAFPDPVLLDESKLSILSGSTVAAVIGAVLLRSGRVTVSSGKPQTS